MSSVPSNLNEERIAEVFRELLPKTSTQAASFSRENPEFDGRGVVIAILDTGVDPGASGLHETTTNSPKLIDIQDCTGSGDVDMHTFAPVQFDEDKDEYFVLGLTGKRLVVKSHWFDHQEQHKEVRVGTKPAFDLFPNELIERLKKSRRAAFDRAHNIVEAALCRELARLPESCSTEERVDVEDRLSHLKKASEDYVDLGPILDVVSFQNEEGMWQVMVDTHEPIGVYRVSQQFSKLDDFSQMNYGVNVYENGDVVSIVTDAGSHGTHVASIASAYFPNDPSRNGVAPGAQIISFKIGDTRLGGGMETSNAICRALSHCATAGVDVINMSFGEPFAASAWTTSGRIMELMEQLVSKHNIVFVASAGNAGPALSTLSAPGGFLPSLIGVGAYVDSEMRRVQYSFIPDEEEVPTNYTWSSRGPTLDGSLGVSVSAPGGAIASVPNWTLMGKDLMNGTSMAAPNCAGGVALIISGLKAKRVSVSPFRIKRALETTARLLPHVEAFAQGHGLIQIQDAFACALKAPSRSLVYDLPISVVVFRPGHRDRAAQGVYLRDAVDQHVQDFEVEVKINFPCDQSLLDVGFACTPTSSRDQVQMELAVDLVVSQQQGTRFIKIPSAPMFLNSSATAFKLRVDPTVLPRDGVYFCEVLGMDARNRDAGPLFRVPVTVVRPCCVNEGCFTTLSSSFSLDGLTRKFFPVPFGATQAQIRLVLEDSMGGKVEDNPVLVALHCLQTRSHSRFRQDEVYLSQRLNTGVEVVKIVDVFEGGTLEVCVAKYWSQRAITGKRVVLTVCFEGLSLSQEEVVMGPHNAFVAQCQVTAQLQEVEIDPKLELTRQLLSLTPFKSDVRPLYPESRNSVLGAFPVDARLLWELKLEFHFELKGSFKIRIPQLGLKINEFLYCSPLESQFIQVFEAKSKKLLSTTDYLGAAPSEREIDLKSRGPFVVFARLRHESKSLLDGLKALPLLIRRPLAVPIPVLSFSQPFGPSSVSQFKFEPQKLSRGRQCTVFTSVSLEEIQKLEHGTSYEGTAKFMKTGQFYPLVLNLPANSGKNPTSVPPPVVANKSEEESAWRISLIEYRLKMAKDLPFAEQAFSQEMNATMDLIQRLKSEKSRTLWLVEAYLIQLQHASRLFQDKLVEDHAEDADTELLHQVLSWVDAISSLVPSQMEDEVLQGKVMEALFCQANSLLDFEAVTGHSERAVEELVKNRLEKRAMMDKSYFHVSLLHIKLRLAMRSRRWGTSLALCAKLLDKDDDELARVPDLSRLGLLRRRIHLYESLGWDHVVFRWNERMLMNYPKDYPCFA